MTNGYIPIDMKYANTGTSVPGIYNRITDALRTGKPLIVINTCETQTAGLFTSNQLQTSVITFSNGNYGVRTVMQSSPMYYFVLTVSSNDVITRTAIS